MVAIKMIALILSLGIDTLMMSVALGFVHNKEKLKIALTFASAEAIMPLVGLLVGQAAGRLIGDWAAFAGGLILLGIAGWMLFFESEEEEEKLTGALVGWSLLLTALSISLDELAVGFSIGLIGVPVTLTIILIGLQALIFTIFGLTVGSRLKRFLGEWSEKLAGAVLGLLGAWILIDAIMHIVHLYV